MPSMPPPPTRELRRRAGGLVTSVREPRLVLARRPTRRDHLHGAWRPYTTKIQLERAPMLIAVAARFRTVLGVMLNRGEWPSVPPFDPPACAGKAKISWYGLPEAHLLVLHCSEHRRIALLVLPRTRRNRSP